MKLALVSPPQDARPRLVVELDPGRLLDVPAAAAAWAADEGAPRLARWPETVRDLAEQGEPALDALRRLADLGRARLAEGGLPAALVHDAAAVRFWPPVADPSKFLSVGKNYRAHLDELEAADLLRERPKEPTGFIKLNGVLTGHDASVRRPDGISTMDYEPELAFVIGRRAHGVAEAGAMGHVLGVTAFNDLTAREIQKREVASGTRFWTAKNMPGFGPVGPYVVTLDAAGDVDDIWIACHVNGERRLRFNTREQIHRIPRIIEH